MFRPHHPPSLELERKELNLRQPKSFTDSPTGDSLFSSSIWDLMLSTVQLIFNRNYPKLPKMERKKFVSIIEVIVFWSKIVATMQDILSLTQFEFQIIYCNCQNLLKRAKPISDRPKAFSHTSNQYFSFNCVHYIWFLKWLNFELLMGCHVYFCTQINCWLKTNSANVQSLGPWWPSSFPSLNFYPEQMENSDGARGNNAIASPAQNQ